jgi:hypothetical protein
MPGNGICPAWPKAACLPESRPFLLFSGSDCCTAVGKMIECVGDKCLTTLHSMVQSESALDDVGQIALIATYVTGCTDIDWPAEAIQAAHTQVDALPLVTRAAGAPRPRTASAGEAKHGSRHNTMLVVVAVISATVLYLSGLARFLLSRETSRWRMTSPCSCEACELPVGDEPCRIGSSSDVGERYEELASERA